jgi:hypothetical protein
MREDYQQQECRSRITYGAPGTPTAGVILHLVRGRLDPNSAVVDDHRLAVVIDRIADLSLEDRDFVLDVIVRVVWHGIIPPDWGETKCLAASFALPRIVVSKAFAVGSRAASDACWATMPLSRIAALLGSIFDASGRAENAAISARFVAMHTLTLSSIFFSRAISYRSFMGPKVVVAVTNRRKLSCLVAALKNRVFFAPLRPLK